MLIFEYNQTKYIFIHIPKNCGRYIRKQIYNNFKCFCVNDGYEYPVSYKVSNSDGYNLHDRYLQIKNIADNFIVFVRNPYHRVISFFYYKIYSVHYEGLVTNNPIIDYLRSPIESLKSKSIEEYIFILKTEFKKYILELEMSCQYNYLIDEQGNIPSNMTIYKLEEPQTFSYLGFKDFQLKEYQLSEYFDSESLLIVNNIFQKDFELFNYLKISY
jgi:hypothetical protein